MPAADAPERGDFVWLHFDPQSGREQAGRRPALIVSHGSYNRKVGLALCCPATSQVKGYPFEVPVPEGMPVSGVILSDHIRSVDWKARQAMGICKAPGSLVDEVLRKIDSLTR